MAFISPDANYYNTVMPFGLKNVGATYQRMMARMFWDKIGRTVEVYIDDMVVKSKQEKCHIEDLQGVFEVLGNINCALMLISVLLGWGLASSSDT